MWTVDTLIWCNPTIAVGGTYEFRSISTGQIFGPYTVAAVADNTFKAADGIWYDYSPAQFEWRQILTYMSQAPVEEYGATCIRCREYYKDAVKRDNFVCWACGPGSGRKR